MTTLSTHDTKRQEDVRARLAVLGELPHEWASAVAGWQARAPVGPVEPDTAYLLWQTLVGAWPIDDDRLTGYLTKVIREAKTRTTWTEPDPAYEEAVLHLARTALADPVLTGELTAFVQRLAPHARANSLGGKLVQLTMPGVPDTYQGCELTGLALVDPDNRRPVDFGSRRALLTTLEAAPPHGLDEEKLLVTSRALRLRRDRPEWFAGPYEPLRATGPAAGHAVAFRRGGAVPVVTRLSHGLARTGGWGGTVLSPGGGPWHDLLTGRGHQGPDLPLADLLADLPVALLVPAADADRTSEGEATR